MQLELTVHGANGAERDIRVTAPDDTSLGAIADRLRLEFPEAVSGLWSGSRRLPFEVTLGELALPTGTTITAGGRHAIVPTRSRPPTDAVVRLHVVGGPEAGRIEALPAGETVIGRSTESGLVLRDARLSRRHAAVSVTATGIHVRDLASTNGTRLDDTDVDEAGCRLRPGAHLQIGDSTLSVAIGDPPTIATRRGPDGTVLLQRQPRPAEATNESPLVEPGPLDRVRPQRTHVLTALFPALAGAAIALVTHQLLFLAFAVAGPAALVASMLIERRRQRRADRATNAQLRQRRHEAAADQASRLVAEVGVRRASHPDPAAIRRAVATRDALVWQRHRDDPCLLEVRVGLADQASRLAVRRHDGQTSPAATVASVPVVLPLRLAPIGICGPRRTTLALARWLIGQLAALHSPADLSLTFVGRGDAATWSWLRRLPHFQAAGLDTHLVPQPPDRAPDRPRRWTVLVIDDPSPADLDALGRIVERDCPNQVTAIWLSADRRALSSAFTSVVSVVGDAGTRLRVETLADPGDADDAAGRECSADQVSLEWARSVSRQLMPFRDSGSAAATALPAQCGLLELHQPAPRSSAAVLEHWRRGGRPVATVGVGADGPVTIDLVQDGPHILIAGTTGAGKSELLRSLVTGLALTNSPADLSFILIDYKGGAAFADCAQLPHTVGFVTDLDAHLAQRALASLRAELRRREGLLAAAGVAEFDAYRRAAERQRNPLGRLVIVVDEFATLADELPDLIGGLLAVARRGRSLGLHLVLATQRPAGAISPEIQANLALRIALRVTDPAESMAVIGAADAAGIDRSRPGRAIVRAGATVREFQTARIGLPAAASGDEVRVELLDEWGRPSVSVVGSDEQPSDLLALIESMRAATLEGALAVPASPWLPPLPRSLTVGELTAVDSAHRIAIGLLDEPQDQRQSIDIIDLDQGVVLLIAGPAQSGRTTALRTIVEVATAQLPETQLQAYAIDCAGGGLAPLAGQPHCGAMLTQYEPEAIGRLVSRLSDEVATRQRQASDDQSRRTRPRLLLLIDGWENLIAAVDAAGGPEPGSIVDGLVRLLRDASSAQLTIAITASSSNLPGRVSTSIQRTFSLGDTVGATAGRATRLPGGNQFQFAWPGPTGTQARRAELGPGLGRPGPIYVRSLPEHVARRDLVPIAVPAPAGVVLGAAGDAADPIAIDLLAGDGRWLIAGPGRSGRTTLLVSMLHQLATAQIDLLVAAPSRSPLTAAAIGLGLWVLDPSSTDSAWVRTRGRDRCILLVDDSAAFADQPAEGQLLEFIASAEAADRSVVDRGSVDRGVIDRGSVDRGVVVSTRSDDPALGYRGIAAVIRRSGTGILLQPGPAEGDLLGIRLPRLRVAAPVGRAELVCDQPEVNERKRGRPALPIQLAY